MEAGGGRGAWPPEKAVPREVTRAQSGQAEVGHMPGEAGIRGPEGGPNRGLCCTEVGRHEGEGGTGLGLRTLVQQGEEGALSGDDQSCALCSCKTCRLVCPMIYVPLGVSDGVLGVLMDVKTCVREEGGQ